MPRPSDPQAELRKNARVELLEVVRRAPLVTATDAAMLRALTTFLDARVDEGFRIETRADTHAIIVPAGGRWSFLERLRKPPARHVISVDQHGQVTMAPAEPLRT